MGHSLTSVTNYSTVDMFTNFGGATDQLIEVPYKTSLELIDPTGNRGRGKWSVDRPSAPVHCAHIDEAINQNFE